MKYSSLDAGGSAHWFHTSFHFWLYKPCGFFVPLSSVEDGIFPFSLLLYYLMEDLIHTTTSYFDGKLKK